MSRCSSSHLPSPLPAASRVARRYRRWKEVLSRISCEETPTSPVRASGGNAREKRINVYVKRKINKREEKRARKRFRIYLRCGLPRKLPADLLSGSGGAVDQAGDEFSCRTQRGSIT
ncbi:hypothetical protein DBV15_05938 [Temnothorax longispinosus]|uniref:Uncharacterized protein n=1 Tax=Temnothorax longispinosus TaxID=300112 RepID=A0A4S2KPF3_9HYME|nr:hypothetical protein DBV15_05938 [Temnothorax longispinosus]